jgi:hypothetical protein
MATSSAGLRKVRLNYRPDFIRSGACSLGNSESYRAAFPGSPSGTIAVASVALVVISPLFHGLAVIVEWNSPGPVFFKKERVGKAAVRRLADTSAARPDLGFSAETALNDGLRELVGWWRPRRGEIAAARVGGAR